MGTSTGQTALQPAFSFIDFSDFSNVSNGSNPGDNGTPPAPNFLMSYAVFLNAGDPGATFGAGWYLTSSVTNIVVFGLNDTGFADDNHDDFTWSRSSRNKVQCRFPEHCRCSRACWVVASCSADCAIVVKLKQQPDALS